MNIKSYYLPSGNCLLWNFIHHLKKQNCLNSDMYKRQAVRSTKLNKFEMAVTYYKLGESIEYILSEMLQIILKLWSWILLIWISKPLLVSQCYPVDHMMKPLSVWKQFWIFNDNLWLKLRSYALTLGWQEPDSTRYKSWMSLLPVQVWTCACILQQSYTSFAKQ
jgi:hypothetical protein